MNFVTKALFCFLTIMRDFSQGQEYLFYTCATARSTWKIILKNDKFSTCSCIKLWCYLDFLKTRSRAQAFHVEQTIMCFMIPMETEKYWSYFYKSNYDLLAHYQRNGYETHLRNLVFLEEEVTGRIRLVRCGRLFWQEALAIYLILQGSLLRWIQHNSNGSSVYRIGRETR